ncbi:MAG: hypothetical protein RSB66_03685 [Clostridium sp.]
MRVNFKGNMKDFTKYMEMLILIYGADAKIKDIQSSIQQVRKAA